MLREALVFYGVFYTIGMCSSHIVGLNNILLGGGGADRTRLFFFGRGSKLEIFLCLQGSEFIQTLVFIYNHLAKKVSGL